MIKTLESFYHFNAEEFIRELKRVKKRKRKLQERLEAISELPSVENPTGIKGSNISDPTLSQAIKREKILKELDEIARWEKAYEYAKNELSQSEREILIGFFESRIPNWRFVSKWQEEHYIGSTKVYNERKKVLRKIETIMERFLERG